MQTSEETTLAIAGCLRSAHYFVKSPFISGILAGWIPSPFAVHDRWPIVQWRSVEGFSCPTNSIVLYYHDKQVYWVADAWIPDPRQEEVIGDFAAEFNSATKPIVNGHVRELASLLAFYLIDQGLYKDDVTSEDYGVTSPIPGNEVWQKWWKAIMSEDKDKPGKRPTG